MVEGQKARTLIDSSYQLSSILLAWVRKLKLDPQQLHSVLQIEGSGGLEVPYLGYVEACLRVHEVKAFDTDVLFLIVPDSAHTTHTSITFGTLHIDMMINLATETQLENLNKQWNRHLIVTKLAMKEAQLVNQEDAQIDSQIGNLVKVTKNTTVTPSETIKVKGVIKTPRHYEHINVTIDDLLEQHCKDIAVVHQIQILRPGSNKVPVVLQNLSYRVVKIKEQKRPCGEGNVVPPIAATELYENIPEKAAGKPPKGDLLRKLPEENKCRLQKLFESLNLDVSESWSEQQQQSVRNFLMEY